MSAESEHFETLADAFQRATGMMAPGKDVPAAMASDEYERERQAKWKQWLADGQPQPVAASSESVPPTDEDQSGTLWSFARYCIQTAMASERLGVSAASDTSEGFSANLDALARLLESADTPSARRLRALLAVSSSPSVRTGDFVCGAKGPLSEEVQKELDDFRCWLALPKPRPEFRAWRRAPLRAVRPHTPGWIPGAAAEETADAKATRIYSQAASDALDELEAENSALRQALTDIARAVRGAHASDPHAIADAVIAELASLRQDDAPIGSELHDAINRLDAVCGDAQGPNDMAMAVLWGALTGARASLRSERERAAAAERKMGEVISLLDQLEAEAHWERPGKFGVLESHLKALAKWKEAAE